MEIETKVISTEIIKPSSPTPKHLQKYKFSFIDQVIRSFMIPTVYFYSSNPEIPNSEKTNHLKKSLSETLSRFYPLAGRLVDNLYVDCNDTGVPFSEAVANCELSQVITNPDVNEIKKHLVYKLDGSQLFLLAVQATYFRCGGVAVGILLSHRIADGYSLVMFSNAWSAIARNEFKGSVASPKFDGAAYFPPGDIASVDSPIEGVVAKTFKFPAAKIALLQESYFTATGGEWHPGRIETVSAYISTRLLLAMGMQADPAKTYFLIHPINLRSLINPPMLRYNFGNMVWLAIASLTAGDNGVEVAQKLRQAKKAIKEGYLPQRKDLNDLAMAIPDVSEGVVSFSITSLCGFPLYEVDFGWDKPVWVVLPSFSTKNTVVLTDTKNGDGIEVVIHLSKQHMEKFEVDLVQMVKSNL